MDEISLSTLGLALAVLLASSGFFSLAETAMMAVNRYRLKHRAQRGERGAKLAVALLGKTDRLLGVILLGNNLINAAAATLTAVIMVRLLGEGEFALAVGTVAVTFAILVFSEITPKVIGATHADRIAPIVSYLLAPMLKVATPVVWFVNLFVQGLLRLMRINPHSEAASTLTQEELRSLVLEGQYFGGKHRTMLANLLDLEAVTVDDVMTPRNQIHALDLAAKASLVAEQLATSYYMRLPVYERELDNIVGVVDLKQVVHLQRSGDIGPDDLRPIMRPAYFVPAGTPLLTQLQQFQNDHERLGLVVDEYGELVGLVTIEDIIEEIIGEFTTQAPDGTRPLPARGRRHRRRRRTGAAAHPESPARHAFSRGRPENAEWGHRRASGRNPGCRDARPCCRPGHRSAADAGSWRKGRTIAGAGRADTGAAFTKPGWAGIIDRVSFMRLE